MSDQDRLLDGTRTARAIRAEVAAEVAALRAAGITPRLDVVLVGDDPASRVYVGSKAKACAELGIASQTHELPAAAAAGRARGARRPAQRRRRGRRHPGPAAAAGGPRQPRGARPGRPRQGRRRLPPAQRRPAPAGQAAAWRHALRPASWSCCGGRASSSRGRRAVVVGRSDIVGKPMAMMLLHAHATVTLCHSRTRDLAAVTRQAEILVVAAGRLALVGAEHVAEGAVVVDVGIHRVERPGHGGAPVPGQRQEARRVRVAGRGARR